jgi:hypothetical protein
MKSILKRRGWSAFADHDGVVKAGGSGSRLAGRGRFFEKKWDAHPGSHKNFCELRALERIAALGRGGGVVD